MGMLATALIDVAHEYELAGRGLPTIKLAPFALLSLAHNIEKDIGGRLYDQPYPRFKFAGLTFEAE